MSKPPLAPRFLALFVALATGAAGQSTTLLDRLPDESISEGGVTDVAMSADGGVVAFATYAEDLVTGDNNGFIDLYALDRATGVITRISVGIGGADTDGLSGFPSLSRDGRFVTFYSAASNLVPNDTNATSDIFLHDRSTGTTTMVSVGSSGAQGRRHGAVSGVSDDGNRVVFTTWTAFDPNDTNKLNDVYVRDVQAGTTTLVSVDEDGSGGGNGDSGGSSISADGALVAFSSGASDLVAGDVNGKFDVFVRDLTTGTTSRVNYTQSGAEPDGDSGTVIISGDGSTVVFESWATNYTSKYDGNSRPDVFAIDLGDLGVELLSHTPSGEYGDDDSGAYSLSADGRWVTFASSSDDLVPADDNIEKDVFVCDRLTGLVSRASVADDGSESDGYSSDNSISDDGTLVVFASTATNLVADTAPGTGHVFVRERSLPPASATIYGAGLAGTNGAPALTSSAPPLLGAAIDVTLSNSLGSTTVGVLVVGFGRASLPLFGGMLLVSPTFWIPVSVPASGLVLAAAIPADETLAGLVVDAQGLEIDPGAPRGVSLSAGLELVLGY